MGLEMGWAGNGVASPGPGSEGSRMAAGDRVWGCPPPQQGEKSSPKSSLLDGWGLRARSVTLGQIQAKMANSEWNNQT